MRLRTILENVRLLYLLEREEGGWDANLNWQDTLSLGEQQRLGMVSALACFQVMRWKFGLHPLMIVCSDNFHCTRHVCSFTNPDLASLMSAPSMQLMTLSLFPFPVKAISAQI